MTRSTQGAPVITIDGPSGSGKGTVARRVASEFGFFLLDSGALYRLLSIAADRAGLDAATDEGAARAADLGRALQVDFEVNDAGGERILLDGEDVTTEVRDEARGGRASVFAALPDVRLALLDLQHGFRRAPGLVADGRDMGTVVFPDAELKIFLTASARERAERRVKQLSELGINANLDRICREIEQRDERDRNRAHSPLVAADDAVEIDTTGVSIDEVVSGVIDRARAIGL